MTPIVFLDTETTSLRPDRKAWEVAMIRDHGNRTWETTFFIDLTDLDLPEADPAALDVGRFWQRHPQAGTLATVPDPYQFGQMSLWEELFGQVLTGYDAARHVRAWTHEAHLVGAVPNFDAEVLAALLRGNWLTPTWHYHLIDVENLAAGWLAARGHAPELPWESDNLSHLLGVNPPSGEERHTALGDAKWAARVYDKVMGA